MPEMEDSNNINWVKIGLYTTIIVSLIAAALGLIELYDGKRDSWDNWQLNLIKIMTFFFALSAVFASLYMIFYKKEMPKSALKISLIISYISGILFLTYLFPLLPWVDVPTRQPAKIKEPEIPINETISDKQKNKKSSQNSSAKKKKEILVYIHIGQFEKATSKWVETYISMDSLTKISDLRNSNDFETSQPTGCFVSLPKNLQDIVTVSNVSYMIDEKVRINIKDVVLGYSQNGIDNYFAQIYIQP